MVSSMALRVEDHPGDHGDPEPVALWLGDRRLQVLEVVDRWFAPAMRWFRVHAEDGQLYVLRLDETTRRWELAALTRQVAPVDGLELTPRGPHISH
jgi:hypothetical protein